jgi:hypothetical protein
MIPEKIDISPASKINQLNESGRYIWSIFEAESAFSMEENEECLITKDEKSRIKDTKISTDPRTINNTTGKLIKHCSDRRSIYKIVNAKIIIVRETSTGASTGPVHTTGTRNRMSQVNQDAGQSRTSFKKT